MATRKKEGKSRHKRIDSRRYARIDVALDVRFVIISVDPEAKLSSETIQSETKSISVNGACLATNVLQSGGLHICASTSGLEKNKLKLEIDLPSDSKKITPLGEVRWYNLTSEEEDDERKYLYNVGISFIDLSKEDREALEAFINKKRKEGKTHFGFIRDWF